jgi:hypothetical protein
MFTSFFTPTMTAFQKVFFDELCINNRLVVLSKEGCMNAMQIYQERGR